MPINSNKKGKSFERFVVNKLRATYPDAKRHLEFQTQEAKGVDLDNTGPFKVQCKALSKVPNIPQVFAEFKDLSQHEIPVVIFKVDGKGSFAAFRIDDALILLDAFDKSQTK